MYKKYFSALVYTFLVILLSSCGGSNNNSAQVLNAIMLESLGLLTILGVDSSKGTEREQFTSSWTCDVFYNNIQGTNGYIYIINDIKPINTKSVILSLPSNSTNDSYNIGSNAAPIDYTVNPNPFSSGPVDAIYIESSSEVDLVRFMRNILPSLINGTTIKGQSNRYIEIFKKDSTILTIGSRITNTSLVTVGGGAQLIRYKV